MKIRSPIWSPGAIWSPIWSSDEACFSSHLFKRPLIFAQKAQLQSNLVTQERSGRLEAIWSPIRSPGHLVVDLVLEDAFSLTNIMIERASAIHSRHFNLVWWSMSNCQAYLAMVDPFHHVDAYVRDVKESPGLIPHVTLF